jgi:hypothetical protein
MSGSGGFKLPVALCQLSIFGALGWLGLSSRSPGRGIEDSATATQPEKSNLTEP